MKIQGLSLDAYPLFWIFGQDSEHNVINKRIPLVAVRRSKDGDPTSNHWVALSNCLVCVERRESPSFTHCDLHVFPFLDCHRCSNSSEGICTYLFTSEDVGDVTDVKLLMKRLYLVVVRQHIKLHEFKFLIHLVNGQLKVPKGFQHGDAGFKGEF